MATEAVGMHHSKDHFVRVLGDAAMQLTEFICTCKVLENLWYEPSSKLSKRNFAIDSGIFFNAVHPLD